MLYAKSLKTLSLYLTLVLDIQKELISSNIDIVHIVYKKKKKRYSSNRLSSSKRVLTLRVHAWHNKMARLNVLVSQLDIIYTKHMVNIQNYYLGVSKHIYN